MQRYIRLATYDLTRGTFQELTELTKNGMLPIFSKEPGFVEYGVADLGNRQVCSITIWETREQAERSVNVASAWVSQNIADRVKLVNSHIGEFGFLHGALVPA